MSHATASGFSQPCLALWEGRHMMIRLKFAVFGMWTLAVLFTLNYAFLRMCVSDMRWHARQLDIIPRVVGTRGFPVLPGVACPRYLAVVVCSAVDRFEHRAAIRATWGRDVGDDKGSGVFFLVGKPDATPRGQDIQNRLINESARHNDVIQADFRDTYRNLTIKTLFLLKWAYVNCSSTRFLLKADDDMFVNVERLISFLKAYGGNRAR
ncbi:beta-1,3-galactosyltransferase 4-like isoform X2 [Dermacentor andersoni]|nr:beta-1,3-galactosyltransferase 4-like isoform X2 [Dermacentor andersoni]